MNLEQKERMSTSPLFGEADAVAVVKEMGASFRTLGAASRQGGGSTEVDPTWPNGYRVELRDLADLEGACRALGNWGVPFHIAGEITGVGTVYCATIRGQTRRAKTATGALWLAAIGSGLRPYANAKAATYVVDEDRHEVEQLQFHGD